ncbi:MAG TPA: thioredoxin [Bacillota bacterium]
MPVLIDQRACDNSSGCSAVRVCPTSAIHFNTVSGKIEADNSKCRSCKNHPCDRVCPAGAVKWFAGQAELEAAQKAIAASTLTQDDLLEQRYGVRPGDPAALGPNLYHVDCDNFKREVLEAGGPVVVDFWASWCAPCRVLAPTFKALAAEYEGQVKFAKLDTEECRDIPNALGIMSIPTMLFFNHGELVDQAVGALPKEAIRRKLDAVAGAGGRAAGPVAD